MYRPRGFKPLPTIYQTRNYRSKLEAKWAVFWRALGVTAEYEAQGFDVGDGMPYLPDFRIPDWGAWVEIKPHGVSLKVAEVLCQGLAEGSGWIVMLIVGEPGPGSYEIKAYGHFKDQRVVIEGGRFGECPRCEGFGIVNDWGWQEIGPHPCRNQADLPLHDPVHSPRLFEAYAEVGLERFDRRPGA